MGSSHGEMMREMEEDMQKGSTKGGFTPMEWPHTPPATTGAFIKKDEGKVMMSLVEPKFVEGVAKTLTMGAEKYSIDNWKLCEDPRRYKDALLRHLYAYLDGEMLDPESGLSHLYHVGFNTMALDHFDRMSHDKV